jgi:uncharacterized protein
MVVKEYNNARVFLDNYEAVLLEREAVSQLILYSALKLSKNESDENYLFGAVLEEDKTILLFCNVAPHNLVMYVANQEHVASASAALAEYLGNSHIAINGINARHDVCLNFIEQYKKIINCTFVEKLGTDIMEIRKVNDIKPVEGISRMALAVEIKFIADWMIQYQIEALASEMDYEAALQKAMKLVEENNIYLFENNEHKVVTMAAASRKLVHGIAINYVYTPEEYRGKGYAAANIYYLSKHLLDNGYEFCTLYVDKKNPLSSRAYEKVGYKTLEDNYEYTMIITKE